MKTILLILVISLWPALIYAEDYRQEIEKNVVHTCIDKITESVDKGGLSKQELYELFYTLKPDAIENIISETQGLVHDQDKDTRLMVYRLMASNCTKGASIKQ